MKYCCENFKIYKNKNFMVQVNYPLEAWRIKFNEIGKKDVLGYRPVIYYCPFCGKELEEA